MPVGRAGLPPELRVDGKLGEWEELAAQPADVVFALASERLVIAGTVPGGAEGFVVELDFGCGDLPTLGTMMRGGGVAALSCEHTWDGQPLDEASAAQCRALLGDADEFTKQWQAEFARSWSVEGGVVARRALDGSLLPVDGAQLSQDGERFELSLPPAALPLASSAPVSGATVLVHSRRASPGPDAKVGISFGDGVAFGQRAELRRAALEVWNAGFFEVPSSVGYTLGDDASWIVAERGLSGLTYERKVVPLWSPVATLTPKRRGPRDPLATATPTAEVQVGRLFAGMSRIATTRGGAVVATEPFFELDVHTTEERPPGLHVFASDIRSDLESGAQNAVWHVYVIEEDGQIHALELAPPFELGVRSWASVIPFDSTDMRKFGFQGTALDLEGLPVPNVRATFTYDAAAEAYLPSVRGMR